MPKVSLTTNEKREDIRKLAEIDRRHRFLASVDEGWFDRSGLIILTERAEDETPLVGVMLAYPEVCPADKTADLRIKYWVANLDRPADLDEAFKRNIQAIHDEMVTLGVRRVWGAVPKQADHLTVRLNPIAVADKCEKVDGADVLTANEPRSRYGKFWFFFGDRDTVNNKVQRHV